MTSRQTRKTSRAATKPADSANTTSWVDHAGTTWYLTAHWALVDGRLTMVGLDIRADDDRPAELTQRVLRGVPISHVREELRAQAAAAALHNAELMTSHAWPTEAASIAEAIADDFRKMADAITAKGEPKKRLPAASSGLLDEVARLYLAAMASGDKTPAKSVEDALRTARVPISERGGRDQVRKWIQRARERGLIPPVGERK